MNQKRVFKANSWLVPSSDNKEARAFALKKEHSLPSLLIKDQHSFSPSHFLIPGWSGEGLISKSALKLKNNLNSLVASATQQFTKVNSSKTFQKLIYQEFLLYAVEHDLHLKELDGPSSFWHHIQQKDSFHHIDLQKFINIYCFKAVTLYLFKIRFILILEKELKIKNSETSLMNPNSFFHRLFKKGSSKELHADSLKLNEYSWYRPSIENRPIVQELIYQLPNVSVTEIIKICSQDSHSPRDPKKLDFNDTEYSHSLSHKSFGLFINKLLIGMPRWLENKEAKETIQNSASLKVLNTKFSGASLTSLSLSHCLAQEQNSRSKWSQIICPDFFGEKFNNGNFLKYCHELQFLSFLVQLAKRQELDPLELICHVMNEKYSKKFRPFDQISMFLDQDQERTTFYDRILLNLNHLPKRNTHHALCSKIQNEKKHLSEGGYLYVLTNQKLFIPSLSEKIDHLLLDLDLKASLNFENLQGKGEISNYVLIFQKKEMKEKPSFDMNAVLMGPTINKMKKENCLNIEWKGNLSQFNNFEILVDELSKILKSKKFTETPLLQRELKNDLSFELYQDVIVKGKLLSSATSDPDKITHPNFFKNLVKSCLPFSYFFHIENINSSSSQKNDFTNDFLGIQADQQKSYPLLLIINHHLDTHTQLMISSSESYQGMAEKYGHAYYHYYGLTPKVPHININLFREFFNSPIGLQVIQLSLGGNPVKTKAKLKSLLIPKFFANSKVLPPNLESHLSFLGTTPQKMLATHPNQLEHQFEKAVEQVCNLSSKYPYQATGSISHFKFNVEKCLKGFAYKDNKKLHIDFRNPLIRDPLLQLKSFPLLPKHEDIFIEFVGSIPSDIHQSLFKAKVEFKNDQHCLELYSKEKLILNLYSEVNLLNFIKFILSQFQETSISSIVQSLHIPKLNDFNQVIQEYKQLQILLEQLSHKAQKTITDIFTQQIISNSNSDF